MLRVSSSGYLSRKICDTSKVREDLTLSWYDVAEQETRKVQAYKVVRGGLLVPRQYALKNYEDDYEINFNTSEGQELDQSVFRKTPKPRPHQKPVIDKIVKLYKEGYLDTRVQAYTGSGKTFMSISACKSIGRNVLVLVDQGLVRDEWVKNLKTHFGLRDSDIGFVQRDRWDYEGKAFTIAMVQTLMSRQDRLPEGFKDYFGVCVIDEVHTAGAPQTSQVLFMINADFRFGVSAHPYREDGLNKILEYHLGGIDVVLKKKHNSNRVRVVKFPGVYSWYSNISPKTGRFINEIAEDPLRNALLCKIGLHFYESGRYILMFSERIGHLYNLYYLLVAAGVPEEDIGLATGKKIKYRYVVDNRKVVPRPVGYVKGTEYCPVMLEEYQYKRPDKEINEAKTKKIMLVTYSLFAKAVDVPHVSVGVECTPRSKVEQPQGRVLREDKGKLLPIWVTIWDYGSVKATYQLLKRIPRYVASNSRFALWTLGKGIKEVQENDLTEYVRKVHRMLENRKIVTSLDGFYISATVKKDSRSKLGI